MQQQTIKDIAICSYSHHLKWRAGMSDHPSTITAKVLLICLNRIRGKFLNVIFNQICLICILGINQLKENFLAKL
jgi:hypothetical protein